MAYNLCISFNWQGSIDRAAALERVRIADEAGVDAVFVAEAWGQDAFSLLTQIADRTRRIRLGTGIVNYYSRTPAALAQHFATLDELSEGRAIVGLGASAANVIEHFHGVPFKPTLTRMRETVAIINILIANQPLKFEGKLFKLERGFTLRFQPYRDHIPIFIASFRPAAVRVVAQVADGWLPRDIPIQRLAAEVIRFREQAREAGRDPEALTIRSPGGVIVARDRERAIATAKARTAFYIARMGDFYYQQLCDMGFADDCNAIRRAWAEGGSSAGAAAVSDEMQGSLYAIGSVEECRDWLAREAEAGVNLHNVDVADAESASEEARFYERLRV